MQEIERKFLAKNTSYQGLAYCKIHITQGFLSRIPERTVRVRITDDKGFITVKGKSDAKGVSRFEWEKEIPIVEAQQLLELCELGIIHKIRYCVKQGNHIYEIDEFQSDLKGLTIIEVELSSSDEFFEKPQWLGKEVTGDKRFYNSYLSNPVNRKIIQEFISSQI